MASLVKTSFRIEMVEILSDLNSASPFLETNHKFIASIIWWFMNYVNAHVLNNVKFETSNYDDNETVEIFCGPKAN